MRIHYFNPGYESSVEQGNCYYTPPRMVQQLRRDLQLLPIYYAKADEAIFLSSSVPSSLLPNRYVTYTNTDVIDIEPWGWAPELVSKFPNAHIPFCQSTLSEMYSRQMGVLLWHKVYECAPSLFINTPPREILCNDSIARGRWVLKEDYSSSGRGVEFITSEQDVDAIVARRFGRHPRKRLYIEPYYDIKEERGFEFWRSDSGEITYIGEHHAITDHGRYIGSQLGESVTADTKYIEAITCGVKDLPLGTYSGVIGVDSALYVDNGVERWTPCLEVNIRPTMGYLAICLQRDYLRYGQRGIFRIVTKDAEKLKSLRSPLPLYLNNQEKPLSPRLYLLTPILPETHFVACLDII